MPDWSERDYHDAVRGIQERCESVVEQTVDEHGDVSEPSGECELRVRCEECGWSANPVKEGVDLSCDCP